MRITLINISALLISSFFMLVGRGLLGTLIPLQADLAAFSAIEIGIIGAAQFTGFAVGCLICPIAVRRSGHIRAFAAFCAIAACAVLIMPIFINPIVWGILRAINGVCMAGLFMVIESWLNERAENEYRGRVFSIYQVIILAGSVSGQQLLGLGKVGGYELFSVAAFMLILALVPTAMTRSIAPTPLQSVKPRLLWVFKISPLALTGCTLVGFANGSLWSLAPIYASQSGLSFAEVGWFMTAIIGGGALTQFPIGRLSDQFDRRIVFLGVTIIASLIGLALAVIPSPSLIILLGLAGCYGGFSLTLYSLCAAHVNDFVKPEDFVHVTSALLLTFGLGAIAGPIIASIVMEMTSHNGLFFTTAATHATIAGYTLYRLARKPRTKPDDFEPFVVSMPKQSPIVSSLDPRVEDAT